MSRACGGAEGTQEGVLLREGTATVTAQRAVAASRAGDGDTRPRVGCGLRRGIGLGKIPVFLLLLLLQDAAERQHLHLREGQVRRGQERGAVLVHLRPPAAGRRRRQQGKGMAGRHAQQSRATPAGTAKLQRGLGQARHTRGVGRQAKQHNVPFAKGQVRLTCVGWWGFSGVPSQHSPTTPKDTDRTKAGRDSTRTGKAEGATPTTTDGDTWCSVRPHVPQPTCARGTATAPFATKAGTQRERRTSAGDAAAAGESEMAAHSARPEAREGAAQARARAPPHRAGGREAESTATQADRAHDEPRLGRPGQARRTGAAEALWPRVTWLRTAASVPATKEHSGQHQEDGRRAERRKLAWRAANSVAAAAKHEHNSAVAVASSMAEAAARRRAATDEGGGSWAASSAAAREPAGIAAAAAAA